MNDEVCTDRSFAADLEPKVSIVIPVYNALLYLEETLNSVCAQSYQNIEILLIDDGSTDGSGELCDRAQKNDKRILVFHKSNGGVSSARNFALENSRGEYILFVDADDLIKPKCVEIMLQALQDTKTQIATCRMFQGLDAPPEGFFDNKTSPVSDYKIISLCDYRWTGDYCHLTIGGLMCAAQLLKGISFSEDIHIGEDTLFFAQALKKAGKFVFMDEQYYFYRYIPTSAVHSRFHEEQFTEITAWERIGDLYSDQSESSVNECESAIATRCKKLYLKAMDSQYADKKKLHEIYLKAFRRTKNVLRSTGLSAIVKVCFVLFILSPRLFYDCKKIIVRRRKTVCGSG